MACPRLRICLLYTSDIGGQDSKVIRLDETGRVTDFVMNDKCAAGTGRFLDMMARTLELDVSRMGEMDRGWKETVTISSMCTVFAESEVVSLIAQNKRTADIVHGLHQSVATKISALLARTKATGSYICLLYTSGTLSASMRTASRRSGDDSCINTLLSCFSFLQYTALWSRKQAKFAA